MIDTQDYIDFDERLAIAEELTGASFDESGRGHCPWSDLHSHKSAKTDFHLIYRDQRGGSFPLVGSCFHASCAGEVEAFNKEWRRRVTRQEHLRREAAENGGDAPRAVARPRKRRQKFPEDEGVTFDAETLRKAAGPLAREISTEWLGCRSRYDPCTISPQMFLDCVYEPGEQVLVFTSFYSQGDFLHRSRDGMWRLPPSPKSAVPMTRRAADYVPRGENGVWFLNQPVDGRWYKKKFPREGYDEEWQRRSWQSVTSWRFLVLECDEKGYEREWVAFLAQLEVPVVAMYTSAGKSVHALIRMDAESKAQFDAERKAILGPLVTMGADPKAMSGVRLTRLPGCQRAGRLQKLLYINPEADTTPIVDLLPRRNLTALVREGLGRDEGKELAERRKEYFRIAI